MRCLSVSGCSLLVVAGCGGGRAVEEMAPAGPPEPVSESMLRTTGEARPAPVDMSGDGGTTVFCNWGVWGGVLRDDVVTCAAIGCPTAGDAIPWAYLTIETGGSVATTVTGRPSGTSPVDGNAVWIGDVHAYDRNRCDFRGHVGHHVCPGGRRRETCGRFHGRDCRC